MSYNKTVWENEPSTATPITAERLNNMENGIEDVDNRVSEIETNGWENIKNKIKTILGLDRDNYGGNAWSATKLKNERAIVIGNHAEPFDGTKDAKFSLDNIGAAASDHTHSKLTNDNGSLLYEYISGRNHLYNADQDNLGTYDHPFNCLYANDVYLTSEGSLKDKLAKFIKKSDIANNFTTTDATMVAAAPLVKQLKEDVETNSNMIINPVQAKQHNLSELVTKEDIGIKWGKVALAVQKLISHLNSEDTPHGLEPYNETEVIDGSTETVTYEGIKFGNIWLKKQPHSEVVADYLTANTSVSSEFINASIYIMCKDADNATAMYPRGIDTDGYFSQNRKEDTEIGDNSMTQGYQCEASGRNSFAGGNSTKAQYDNQTVLGKYNFNRSENLFEVGCGDSEYARANAFEVDKSGNATSWKSVKSPSGLFDALKVGDADIAYTPEDSYGVSKLKILDALTLNKINTGAMNDETGEYDYNYSMDYSGGIRADSFTGALTGNASTATKLKTARTLTIGSKGKTFDGSANVSWTLAEIGAAASDHTHSKLKNNNGSLLYEYISGRNHLYNADQDNLGTYDHPFNCLYANDVYLTSEGSLKDKLAKFIKKSDIAANLTTTTTGMVLDATMGKNLQDQITTNANAISKLNSNLPIKIKNTEIEVKFNSTDESRGWFIVLGNSVGVSKSNIKNIIVTSFTAGMTVDGIQIQKEKSNDEIIVLTNDIVADSTAKFGITIFY